jgi:hypothetical protein
MLLFLPYHRGMRTTVDPKLTEQFLLAQDDVQDASVWITNHKLHAHVTSAPGSKLSETRLLEVCHSQIGADQTPVEILLIGHSR